MMTPPGDLEKPALVQRLLAPGLVRLIVLVDILLIAVALVLALARTGAGGDTASLDSAQPETFNAPVALPVNGEYVRTRVLASGDLDVEHWIRSTTAVRLLTLRVPRVLNPRGKRPVFASRVRVTGDGALVHSLEPENGPTRVGRAKESYRLPGATKVKVSYILSGTLVRTGPTRERALLRGTSLDLRYTRDQGPRVVSVSGARILAAACSPPERKDLSSARPCGAADGLAWRVRLAPRVRHEDVLVQLDLS
jgi:hypothetical protein